MTAEIQLGEPKIMKPEKILYETEATRGNIEVKLSVI
jgi:hypothetical protein